MENKKIYFIDIVYLVCYKYYAKHESTLLEYSAQVLLAACLSLNLIAFFIVIHEMYHLNLIKNKWYSIFITIPVLITMVIRYNWIVDINYIKNKMYSYNSSKQIRLNLMAVIYILISIFGTIMLAIYLGELNNPPPFWEKV